MRKSRIIVLKKVPTKQGLMYPDPAEKARGKDMPVPVGL